MLSIFSERTHRLQGVFPGGGGGEDGTKEVILVTSQVGATTATCFPDELHL